MLYVFTSLEQDRWNIKVANVLKHGESVTNLGRKILFYAVFCHKQPRSCVYDLIALKCYRENIPY
jgi:hypothetical protein